MDKDGGSGSGFVQRSMMMTLTTAAAVVDDHGSAPPPRSRSNTVMSADAPFSSLGC